MFHAVYPIVSITNVFIGNYLFSVKVEEENTHLKEQAKFRANPAKVLHQEPFCPAKSSKPLTGTVNTETIAFFKRNFLVVLLVHRQVIESPKNEHYIHMVYEMLLFDGRACFQLERFFTGFKKKPKNLLMYMHTCINWCLTFLQFVNVFEYVKLML